MKSGYVPTYLKLYDDAYIQNKLITTDTEVFGYYMIKVGNNVYDGPLNCSTGNVVVTTGNRLTLEARSKVLLDTGFRSEDGEDGGEFEVIVPFE